MYVKNVFNKMFKCIFVLRLFCVSFVFSFDFVLIVDKFFCFSLDFIWFMVIVFGLGVVFFLFSMFWNRINI